MARKRIKMSRLGDSVTGPRLLASYEYYKSIHDRNKEKVLEISIRIAQRAPKRYYTSMCGKVYEVPAERAVSFADQDQVLLAVLNLKEQNPKMHLPLNVILKKYALDILQYITENLAEDIDSWQKKSGNLIIR